MHIYINKYINLYVVTLFNRNITLIQFEIQVKYEFTCGNIEFSFMVSVI